MKKIEFTEEEKFYKEVLRVLNKNRLRYLLGGTYALTAYTGIKRKTKDLDLFCRASDHTKFVKVLKDAGFKTEIRDARWLAKVKKGRHYVDLIFGRRTQIVVVDETWFEHARNTEFLGEKMKLVPVEEFIWEKSYIQSKEGYGGPDINHLILKYGKTMDWKRLLRRMEAHWELLLGHLINFRFVYPSDRSIIPKWLMRELIRRLQEQLSLPHPKDKVTRGNILSGSQYDTDIKEWGYLGTS